MRSRLSSSTERRNRMAQEANISDLPTRRKLRVNSQFCYARSFLALYAAGLRPASAVASTYNGYQIQKLIQCIAIVNFFELRTKRHFLLSSFHKPLLCVMVLSSYICRCEERLRSAAWNVQF